MRFGSVLQAIFVATIGSQIDATYALVPPASAKLSGETKTAIDSGSSESISKLNRREAKEEDEHDHEHDEFLYEEINARKPWGEVIGATLLVNMATFSGVIILILSFSTRRMKHKIAAALCWTADEEVHENQHFECDGDDITEMHSKGLNIIIPAFAAGALLSTVVFLIVPESLSLLNGAMMKEAGSHEDHAAEIDNGAAWRFGAGMLGGFMLPILLGALFPRSLEHECDSECGPAQEAGDSFLSQCLVPDDHLSACDDKEGENVVKVRLNHTETTKGSEHSNCSISHRHEHGHSHEEHAEGDDCAICNTNNMTSEDNVKCVDVPEFKERAFEMKADVQATQTCNKIEDEHAGNDPGTPNDNIERTCTIPERELKPINLTLALSILIGDALHNFCDGIFIGVAFKLCGRATAWTIVFITLYHEIAQEIADFFLLTDHAGLTITRALVVNFVSGLSVVLGGVVVIAIDVSDLTIGVILAIGSGVYVYIAATECVPRVNSVVKTNNDRLMTVFAFIVGVVPIGLALLNHHHC